MTYKSIEPSDLKLYSEVQFRYLNGKEVLDVMGWVAKIERHEIKVGNESHLEEDGLSIYNSKKYKTDKIENLEVRVSSD